MAKRRQKLSLDLLKGFEAAARHLSFTRAAQELFVTQSAVSREVKTLEEQLGTSLFRRLHRGLRLTDSGQVLYRAVGDALKLIDAATEQLDGSTSTRRVTVTTVTSFAGLWLVPRLGQFTSLHPDIEVRIAASNNYLDLEREGIDVGIRLFLTGTPATGAPFMKVRACPMCSPGYLSAHKAALRSPEDLGRHVLLRFLSRRGDQPWDDWALWLKSNGLNAPSPARSVGFSHYEQVVNAAMGGQGLGLSQDPVLARYFQDRLLVNPFGRKGAVEWGAFHLVYAPEALEREPVKTFVDWLKDEVKASSRAPRMQEPR